MKKLFLLIIPILAIVGFVVFTSNQSKSVISPISNTITTPIVKKLAQYSYPALQKTTFLGSDIIIDKVLKDGDTFSSYLFYYTVRGKKVSGLMNIPKKAGDYPVILMIRGFVDPSVYTTGMGTIHGGELMAQNGYITLAPDFLGYGYSDKPSPDAMEDRFLTYISTMELLRSIKNLNKSLELSLLDARYDSKHIGMWGHSNGGQIATSLLEISGKNIPTVLWAPVSKPFPYSILYFTDDIDDHGKALRKVVAQFETDYDSEIYSLTNYLDWIQAPIQIHQGNSDEAVPKLWSDTFVTALKAKEKTVEYYTYSGESHNFDQGNWPTVMQRTMAFYKKHFSSP